MRSNDNPELDIPRGPAAQGPLIVLAPDKFKGSLTATEVAGSLARGLKRAVPTARIVEHPIADGGEGTVDVVLRHGFRPVSRAVRGPCGETIVATYALRADTAVIEMAAAAGLGVLPGGSPGDQTARTASTYGVGELIIDAMDHGARHIVLAVGGSATTDGGAGMIAALGATMWTAGGLIVPDGGQALLSLTRLDMASLDGRLAGTSILVACDVDNPLTGPDGAARVYAPQKGASPSTVELLDRALGHWADMVKHTTGHDPRSLPGAGAAGGLGFAAAALLNAEVRPGIEFLLGLSDFPRTIDGADLVIVGEGSLDEQSLRGKGPVGVAAMAARAGVPAVAVAGRCTVDVRQLRAHGITAVYPLTEVEPDQQRSMRHAASLLEHLGELIAHDWLSGQAHHQSSTEGVTPP